MIIASVVQAFKILEFIASESREVGLKYLSEKLQIPPSTLHRYLVTLVESGYLIKTSSGGYLPSFRLVELGTYILGTIDVRRIARPYLVELMQKTGHTVHLVLRDGNEGVYIDKIEGLKTLPMVSRVGMKMSLYSTGFGKAILAYLSSQEVEKYLSEVPLVAKTPNTITRPEDLRRELLRTKERGYAFDNQENEEGICCIGAPILSPSGEVIGAISVAGHYLRFQNEAVRESIASEVKSTAAKISRLLGGGVAGG